MVLVMGDPALHLLLPWVPWAHPRAPGTSSGRAGQGVPVSAPGTPSTHCPAVAPSIWGQLEAVF